VTNINVALKKEVLRSPPEGDERKTSFFSVN